MQGLDSSHTQGGVGAGEDEQRSLLSAPGIGDNLDVEVDGFEQEDKERGARPLSPTSESLESGESSVASSGAVARASEIAVSIRDGTVRGWQQLRELTRLDRQALQQHLRQQRAGAESSCPIFCQGVCRLLFDGLEFAIGVDTQWWFLVCLGALSSALAWAIDELVHVTHKLHELCASPGGFVGFFGFTAFLVVCVLASATITRSVAPKAAGSGIPEMKSFISGFFVPGFLERRTAVAKTAGLVLAQGGGLNIGNEGPFVTVCSVVAEQLLTLESFRHLKRSRLLHADLLAAACAVGVSSTFGAPIGGVLFSIEVTSTLYRTSSYWKGFFAAVVGAAVFKELSYFGFARKSVVSLFSTAFSPLPYNAWELPIFLLLAVLCGYLGGLFLIFFSRAWDARLRIERGIDSRWRSRRPSLTDGRGNLDLDLGSLAGVVGGGGSDVPTSTRRDGEQRHRRSNSSVYQVPESATGGIGIGGGAIDFCVTCGGLLPGAAATCMVVGLLTAVLSWPLGDFASGPLRQSIDDLFTEGSLKPLGGGGANGTATMRALVDAAATATGSAPADPSSSEWGNGTFSTMVNVAIFSVVKFLLSALSLTLPLPSGVITPVFAVGAGIGRLAGEVIVLLTSWVSTVNVTAGGYAVVGAAAFTSSVTGTVSVAAIVFELTSQLSYMLPVLLAVLIGRSAGRAVSGGTSIYELLAHKNGLRVPPGIDLEDSYYMQAGDVMRRILVGETRMELGHRRQPLRRREFRSASGPGSTRVRGARGRADSSLAEPLDEASRYCSRYASRAKLRSVLDGELDMASDTSTATAAIAGLWLAEGEGGHGLANFSTNTPFQVTGGRAALDARGTSNGSSFETDLEMESPRRLSFPEQEFGLETEDGGRGGGAGVLQATPANRALSSGATPALGVGCDGNVLVAPLDDEVPIVSSERSGRFICSIAVTQLARILNDEELWKKCPCPELNVDDTSERRETKEAEDTDKRLENRNENSGGDKSTSNNSMKPLFDREGRLDLLSVIDADYSTARVRADAPLGEVVLFFSLKPAHGRVFVTENSVLVGSVCSSDLSGL